MVGKRVQNIGKQGYVCIFSWNLVAHLLGHALGLFHTEEESGHRDPLDDTGTGDSNLMFWYASGENQLSVDQRFVILRSPLVK